MTRPPSDAPSSPGPPDRQTLRLLERTLAREPLVAETTFEPDAYEPSLLPVHLDASQYPSSVEAARLDVRWFASRDFSFHYVESGSAGVSWECRWDRHPNPHNARVHFHEPPNAEEVIDLALSSHHPLDVSATVVTALEDRCDSLWTDES